MRSSFSFGRTGAVGTCFSVVRPRLYGKGEAGGVERGVDAASLSSSEEEREELDVEGEGEGRGTMFVTGSGIEPPCLAGDVTVMSS